MKSEQKPEGKAMLTKLVRVSRPAPDEKGEAKKLYKVFFRRKRHNFLGGGGEGESLFYGG